MKFPNLPSHFTRATNTVLLAVLASTPVWAQQQLVPARSEIAFVSKQMGVPVEGRFKKFDAQIAFDPNKAEGGKIVLTIDIGSITMGSPEPDAELPKAPWFNAALFPKASFYSSVIKPLGAGKFEVRGKLSIKGHAQDVLIPVTLTQDGTTTFASGAFTVQRLAYKIGENEWADTSMVGDDVVVKFKLGLTGVAKF